MEIKIACPTCQQHIAVDESLRGSSLECPSCGSSLRVPEASKTRLKRRFDKTTCIFCSIIGFLILTNALAIFLWRRDAQKTAPSIRTNLRRAIVRPTPSPQPSPTADALMRSANGAVVNDNLSLLKQLLDAHPEIINQHFGDDSNRSTMLILAAYSGKADILEELLKRKADVNARTMFGHTALYACVQNRGTKEMAMMLLDDGADFTIADNNGVTPLKVAIQKNRQDIVDLLRQRGAKE